MLSVYYLRASAAKHPLSSCLSQWTFGFPSNKLYALCIQVSQKSIYDVFQTHTIHLSLYVCLHVLENYLF